MTLPKLNAGSLRVALVLMAGLLPDGKPKKFLLRSWGNWDIHPTGHIGSCLFINLDRVSIGQGSRIASFSVYRDLSGITLGDFSRIGHWNWISAAVALRTNVNSEASPRWAELVIGRQSAITTRHYIDCSGGVGVGDFSVIAGVRSTIVTHQVDLKESKQTLASVSVGDYCLIGSNVKLVPGAQVPNRSLVGMGSVVLGGLTEPGRLYAGVPAKAAKILDDCKYFHRTELNAQLPES